ncbi:MAG: hypothetical protein WCT01_01630 [Candidatus Shapirobacteria bacterium]
MAKTDKSFYFTPIIFFRLFVFFLVYLVINYYFLNSQVTLPPSVTKYSQTFGASIASSAQTSLGKYATSSATVSYVNKLLNGQLIGQNFNTLTTNIKNIINQQLQKYQRQVIDKIYQDLTRTQP